MNIEQSTFNGIKQVQTHLLLLLMFSLFQKVSSAQVTMQNNGTLFVTNSGDTVFLNGTFNNATTASLTNNGNFYISQDVNNYQPAMATGTGTLYLNGTIHQSVNGTQTFKTFNLVTNNTTGFTLNNNLSVTGMHNYINGLVTTSALPNFMLYETGAAYNGTDDNRHVNGWVKKRGTTDFVFPVGNALYLRTLALTSLGVNSEFNVKYNNGPTPNYINFTTITTLPAKNNSGTSLYTYCDVTAMYQKVFYRLRYIDGGTTLKYSGIITIAPQQNSAKEFYILQNPVSNTIDLYTGSFYSGKYSYTLTAAGGQLVQTGQIDIRTPGVQTIINTSHVPYGIYKLLLSNGENVLSKNILKQ